MDKLDGVVILILIQGRAANTWDVAGSDKVK